MKTIFTTIGNVSDSILLLNFIIPSLQLINSYYISIVLGIVMGFSLFSIFHISDLNFIHFSSKKIGDKIIKTTGAAGAALGAYSSGKDIIKDVKNALKEGSKSDSCSSDTTSHRLFNKLKNKVEEVKVVNRRVIKINFIYGFLPFINIDFSIFPDTPTGLHKFLLSILTISIILLWCFIN